MADLAKQKGIDIEESVDLVEIDEALDTHISATTFKLWRMPRAPADRFGMEIRKTSPCV